MALPFAAMRWASVSLFVVMACGPSSGHHPDGNGSGSDASNTTGDSGQQGCGNLPNCYSVYAHSDHVLYVVDLMAKTLSRVGAFAAPQVGGQEDVITDLAVAPDNTIYVISETALYTASATDGHVTKLGSLAACGMRGVALTTTPDGKLWTGDFKGAVCQIDLTTSPPMVKPAATLSNGMALSGDLVAVEDGTVYGSIYKLSDPANMGTQTNNVLAKIDLASGAVTQIGPTGYPKLFGTSFALGNVIGFTHDGTGHVVMIDRTTGTGTVFATFMDPMTNMPISFAGAGVNSLVPVIQ